MRRIGSLVSYQIAIARCSAEATLGSSLPRMMAISCSLKSLDPRMLPKWAISAPRCLALVGNEPCSSSPVSAHLTGLFVTTRVLPLSAVRAMNSPTSNSRAVGSGLGFPSGVKVRFTRLPR